MLIPVLAFALISGPASADAPSVEQLNAASEGPQTAADVADGASSKQASALTVLGEPADSVPALSPSNTAAPHPILAAAVSAPAAPTSSGNSTADTVIAIIASLAAVAAVVIFILAIL